MVYAKACFTPVFSTATYACCMNSIYKFRSS